MPAVVWSALADVALLAHLGFLLFVSFGALLIRRFPWVKWVHLPAFAWGSLISLAGWICPLTWLEVAWRVRAGQGGYEGGFIEHYLTAVIYPEGLSREIQIGLGLSLLGWNALLYWRLIGPGAQRRASGIPREQESP